MILNMAKEGNINFYFKKMCLEQFDFSNGFFSFTIFERITQRSV